MHIGNESLDKLAHLSRLEIDPAEREKLLKDLNRMLDFVEKLKEVDTDGIEPLTSMTQEVNRFRKDEPAKPLEPSEVFRNAPKTKDGFFRVPRVIG